MNHIKYLLSLIIISSSVFADSKLKVVATLSTFADLASTIGGEFVETSAIGAARFNPHFIEPRPSDVLRVKRADLYLHSGLDLEAWSGPLVDAAARPELRKNGDRQLDLSKGITLLNVPTGQVSRAEGDIHLFGNPHYWLDPRNGLIMAKTIADKLSELDPQHADQFQANLDAFSQRLNQKMKIWSEKTIGLKGSILIGYHDEWGYLMQFTGLTMDKFIESKPGIPPSPAQISSLIQYAKERKVKAIVQPSFYPTDAGDEISAHSEARVVMISQNVHENEYAKNYIEMIDYDISQIVEALSHA